MVFPSAHRSWFRASPVDRAPRGQGAGSKPGGSFSLLLMQNATPFAPGLSLLLGTTALPVWGIWQDDISPEQRAGSQDSGEQTVALAVRHRDVTATSTWQGLPWCHHSPISSPMLKW